MHTRVVNAFVLIRRSILQHEHISNISYGLYLHFSHDTLEYFVYIDIDLFANQVLNLVYFHKGHAAYMSQLTRPSLVQKWILDRLALDPYLNQYWAVVNWTGGGGAQILVKFESKLWHDFLYITIYYQIEGTWSCFPLQIYGQF